MNDDLIPDGLRMMHVFDHNFPDAGTHFTYAIHPDGRILDPREFLTPGEIDEDDLGPFDRARAEAHHELMDQLRGRIDDPREFLEPCEFDDEDPGGHVRTFPPVRWFGKPPAGTPGGHVRAQRLPRRKLTRKLAKA